MSGLAARVRRQHREAAEAAQQVIRWRFITALHGAALVALALFLSAALAWFRLRHSPLGPALDICFEYYCHRLSERSLWLAGEPMPICSRCTGVVAGYLLGALLAVCGCEKFRLWGIPTGLLLVGLMGFSWMLGRFGVVPGDWHAERIPAGALGGLGGYILISRVVVLLIGWRTAANSAAHKAEC
ncbi:MAG: DUF2085 domain-containing protein [Planctomycetales bacterium]|nr:DUF2085 domain-containing protein [Planctomycetales bacterium]